MLSLGAVIGFGVGCRVEPLEPCATGENNKLDDAGQCECRIGYDWCNPEDASDLDCCPIGSANSETGDGDPTGDGDGDPGGGECPAGEPPPESCSVDEEGFFWCTHTEDQGPCESQLYICQGGAWVLDEVTAQDSCEFDGYDFTYGCVDDGSEITVKVLNDSAAPVLDQGQSALLSWQADDCYAFRTM